MIALPRVSLALGLVMFMLLCVSCSASDRSTPSPTVSTTAESPSASATGGDHHEALAAGVSHASLQYGGEKRTYRVFVPPAIPAGTHVPLLVGLHGGLGSGDRFAEKTGLEDLARQEKFVALFPDGNDGTWNAGGCCGKAARLQTDDVGFLAALITLIEQEAPIDPSRVFMTGHSNGAMMAFRFGCERAGLVKAIAPVAGSLEIPSCTPSRGVSVLAIHGDADQSHPIGGGQGADSIARVNFRSMAETMAMWTGAMKCAPPVTSVAGPLTTTDWKSCKDGTLARYIIIAGAGHPWPGDRTGASGSAAQALDATNAIWSFFSGL